VEQELYDKGFNADDEEKSGDFSDEGWSAFKWRATIVAPKKNGVSPEQPLRAIFNLPLGGGSPSRPLGAFRAVFGGGNQREQAPGQPVRLGADPDGRRSLVVAAGCARRQHNSDPVHPARRSNHQVGAGSPSHGELEGRKERRDAGPGDARRLDGSGRRSQRKSRRRGPATGAAGSRGRAGGKGGGGGLGNARGGTPANPAAAGAKGDSGRPPRGGGGRGGNRGGRGPFVGGGPARPPKNPATTDDAQGLRCPMTKAS